MVDLDKAIEMSEVSVRTLYSILIICGLYHSVP